MDMIVLCCIELPLYYQVVVDLNVTFAHMYAPLALRLLYDAFVTLSKYYPRVSEKILKDMD